MTTPGQRRAGSGGRANSRSGTSDGLAATPGKPLYVYDTESKGLGVRCMPSGVKSGIVEIGPARSRNLA